MRLNELRENPNNPSKCSEADLERLAGKLKRVPLGLTAMRIAYVTDDPGGGKMVISGNKRLRVLKRAFGEDAELPDDYFQDVTAMSEAERHEFIVTANVSDGEWDLDKLMEQYDKLELSDLMSDAELQTIMDKIGIPPPPPDDIDDNTDADEEFDRSVIVRIKFNNENEANEFLEKVQNELDTKYHAYVNVSGGKL